MELLAVQAHKSVQKRRKGHLLSRREGRMASLVTIALSRNSEPYACLIIDRDGTIMASGGQLLNEWYNSCLGMNGHGPLSLCGKRVLSVIVQNEMSIFTKSKFEDVLRGMDAGFHMESSKGDCFEVALEPSMDDSDRIVGAIAWIKRSGKL